MPLALHLLSVAGHCENGALWYRVPLWAWHTFLRFVLHGRFGLAGEGNLNPLRQTGVGCRFSPESHVWHFGLPLTAGYHLADWVNPRHLAQALVSVWLKQALLEPRTPMGHRGWRGLYSAWLSGVLSFEKKKKNSHTCSLPPWTIHRNLFLSPANTPYLFLLSVFVGSLSHLVKRKTQHRATFQDQFIRENFVGTVRVQ